MAKFYDGVAGNTAKITPGSIDGLSYRLYQRNAESTDVIIVYHGGGVNCNAGYDILARQLTASRELAVCLVDIRGHGCSAGERGTVKQTARIWQDVDVIMAEMCRVFPRSRRHLFGHSSGAGMLLNYLTCYPFVQRADSLIMLAPALGPFSGTIHDTASHFSQVRRWPFVINALSGGRLCGQYRAVRLNFPSEVAETVPGLVRQYSVNMANALTPRHPDKQLAALPVPTLLLAAAQDELFSAQAMSDFAMKHAPPCSASAVWTKARISGACLRRIATSVSSSLACHRRNNSLAGPVSDILHAFINRKHTYRCCRLSRLSKKGQNDKTHSITFRHHVRADNCNMGTDVRV